MKTRYEEIEIKRYSGTCIDSKGKRKETFFRYHVDGADVGPIMRSKIEALVGLDEYAKFYGISL